MQLDLNNKEHADAYKFALGQYVSEMPDTSAAELRGMLTSQDFPESITPWEPMEGKSPMEIDQLASHLAEGIVQRFAGSLTNAYRSMLADLCDLHESEADGEDGITEEDWEEARKLVSTGVEVQPHTIPIDVRNKFDALKSGVNGIVLMEASTLSGEDAFLVGIVRDEGHVPVAAMIIGNTSDSFKPRDRGHN